MIGTVKDPRSQYMNISTDIESRIGFVTMKRADKRNALSLEHMLELIDAFQCIGRDREIAVTVLRAEGKVFCSGHDLSEMTGRDAPFYSNLFEVCTELMETIRNVPQIVVAQVHGMATAAGCQLVAACDLAVASDMARFATPGVRIGLFCSTPMVALSRAVGKKKALEMLVTGEPMNAREALEAGLINRVVAADDLAEETRGLAERIAGASDYVLRLGKKAFYEQNEMHEHQAYALTKEVMASNAVAPDAQEGIGAFLEKRTPRWEGR